MLIGLNSALRRQRRRLLIAVAVVALAGAVVAAHTAMGGEHMSDGALMCVAIAETALIAAGAALALGALGRRPLWTVAAPALEIPGGFPAPVVPRARAGPAVTQVFRL